MHNLASQMSHASDCYKIVSIYEVHDRLGPIRLSPCSQRLAIPTWFKTINSQCNQLSWFSTVWPHTVSTYQRLLARSMTSHNDDSKQLAYNTSNCLDWISRHQVPNGADLVYLQLQEKQKDVLVLHHVHCCCIEHFVYM